MIVTFDLGTSRLKVAGFDTRGKLLGEVAIPHTDFQDQHHQQYTFQSTHQWWANCVSGFKQLISRHDLSVDAISCFSVSGRAGAAVFISKDGSTLVEPWLDTRHREYLASLRQNNPEISLYAATLAAKYKWLQQHDDGTAAQVAKILYAKDYIVYRLTGECITDPASGPDQLAWPAIDGVSASLLPSVALPWETAGQVSTTAARELGCKKAIKVALGAHDGISANTGCGMTGAGQFALTLGTHAVSRTVSPVAYPNATRFYDYPSLGHVYGGNALYAGKTISWYLQQILSLPQSLSPEQLDQLSLQVTSSPPGAAGMMFYPYAGGQISPEHKPAGNGQFVGMSLHHTRDDMTRAVFEGVAMAISRVHSHLTTQVGEAQEICLTGGGIVFVPMVQMIADLLQQPLRYSDNACEGRGAAIFGAVAQGSYASCDEASQYMIAQGTVILPSQQASTYGALLDRFEHGYPVPATQQNRPV